MEIPRSVPVMTLPSATLFPQALLPLYIFEPRYRQMLADMLRSHRMFSVAMQKPGRRREMPCPVAGLGLIRVSVDHQDGTSHLILQGLTRVELGDTLQVKPYRVQRIRPLHAPPGDDAVVEALADRVLELVEERVRLGPFPFPFPAVPGAMGAKATGSTITPLPVKKVLEYLESLPSPDQLADLVSCALVTSATERQKILETVALEDRLAWLIRFLGAEIRALRGKG
ncbi:MAG TPA: LON peptidase substrate-binding domain-containing protein, partial [Methylomirabilota bacterium]|nr:LON peptidase substrate-binding domain-containing protein [Methylomirabilota bacterium]